MISVMLPEQLTSSWMLGECVCIGVLGVCVHVCRYDCLNVARIAARVVGINTAKEDTRTCSLRV